MVSLATFSILLWSDEVCQGENAEELLLHSLSSTSDEASCSMLWMIGKSTLDTYICTVPNKGESTST